MDEGEAKRAVTYAIYVALAYFVIAWFPAEFNLGGGAWRVCLDFIGEGTLYGGQPFCNQGPVIYYLLYPLFMVFGGFSEWLPQAILAIGAHACIYLTLAAMLKRDGIYEPRVFSMLYVMLVYRFIIHLTSSVATAFLLAGVYLLPGSRDARKGIACGLLLSLAVFTKYTTILPAVLAIVYYLFTSQMLGLKSIGGKRSILVDIDGKRMWTALLILGVIFTVWAGLNARYENFSEYTLKGHAEQLSAPFDSAIRELFEKRSLNTVAGAIVLAGIAYAVALGRFNRKTMIYPFTQLTIVAYSLLFVFNKHYLGDTRIGGNYMLVAYPFLAATLTALYFKDARLFTIVLIACAVYPSIYNDGLVELTHSGFEAAKADAIKELQWGLHFIPPQTGMVLTEGPGGYEKIFSDYRTQIDPARVVVVNGEDGTIANYADADWTPTLSKEVDLSGTHTKLTGDTVIIDRLTDEIRSGRYSMIMYGPPAWAILYNTVSKNKEMVDMNFCTVYVPNFMYDGKYRSHTSIYFANKNDCENFKVHIENYYSGNFTRFCGYGKRVGDTIKRVFRWNQMTVPYSCIYEYDWAFSEKQEYMTQWRDILIMAVMLFPGYYLVLWYRRLFGVA